MGIGQNEEKTRMVSFGIMASAALLFMSLRVVPPGHVGVSVVFGAVSEGSLLSGPHLVNPFASVKLFLTKTRLLEQDNNVPTQEGLIVELDVAMLYHIDPTRARELLINLGENYEDIVVKPELSSAVRGLTSEQEAKALYTSGRSEIQKALRDELIKTLDPRGIVIEDVLLKAVKLPSQLTHSIEQKAQAEQEANRMEFVLKKETQEADRKAIEARGIASFQKIVSQDLSPGLLKWKGIEATEKLADSNNAKIVIMGNTQDTLPVMLSGDNYEPRVTLNAGKKQQQNKGTLGR